MELSQLLQIMKRCPPAWQQPLLDMLPQWEINTPLRQSAFLANLAIENTELTRVTENLDYSETALLAKFPTHFGEQAACALGRNSLHAADQESIANVLYAGRFGNGPFESGDGWRYRGRILGLTFRDNYRMAGMGVKQPLEAQPELCETPAIGLDVAGWFWTTRGLNQMADAGDLTAIVHKITGGLSGYADRLYYYERAKGVLLP